MTNIRIQKNGITQMEVDAIVNAANEGLWEGGGVCGPRWNGGNNGEEELLYGAYASSLELAKENDCHSIAFPVISAGIFGYPKKEAWRVATQACHDFIMKNQAYDISIFFAVLDSEMMDLGGEALEEIAKQM